MGREVDEQVRLLVPLDGIRVAPRRHQPVVQTGIGLGEMRNKRPVEASQRLAVVKIGKGKPVLEGEFVHRLKFVVERLKRATASRRDRSAPPTAGSSRLYIG